MKKLWLTLFLALMLSGCAFPIEVTHKSVVRITSMNGRVQGTGIVIDKVGDRYVVFTAAHVLAPGNWRIDGYKVLSGVVEPSSDIAIITFKPDSPYKPLKFGNPRRGQHARLMGYPGRTHGVLSQTDGHVMAVNNNFLVSELWYDGGAIPGFSGGPIIDDFGRVLGMAKAHVLGQHIVSGKPQWLCYDTALCCISAQRLKAILANLRRSVPEPSLVGLRS